MIAPLNESRELAGFFALRHIKLFVCAIFGEISSEDKASLKKFMDLVYNNMMIHSAGCLVTVRTETQSDAQDEYGTHCKQLIGLIKDKTDVYHQEIVLSSLEKEKIDSGVQKSIKAIAALTADY